MYCCTECYNNKYIIDFIKSFDEVEECDYCESKNVYVISIEYMGDFLRESLSQAYVNATTDSIPYHLLQRLAEPIMDVLRYNECIFSEKMDNDDTCETLVKDAFESSGPSWRDKAKGADDPWDNGEAEVVLIDEFYAPDNNRFSITWDGFKETVKHGNRFFDINKNRSREEMLNIFSIFFTSMVTVLPKGSEIIRAREDSEGPFEEIEKRTLECGPPPAIYAKSFRMNPDGISYFYGAKDIETCLKEIRPSKEKDIVIGKFQTICSLNLIDLSKVPRISSPSIFSPDYDHDMNWAHDFLSLFSDEISKPIRENEACLEYIPTQILSEYIRLKGFDGVRYKSSLTDGYNYTLFCGGEKENYNFPFMDSLIPDFREWLKLIDYNYIKKSSFLECNESPP